MKKSIFIAIILFLSSTVLQLLLNIIINEQILSRILFGVDYNTYFMNYYSGQDGFIKLISGESMPFNWLFTILKYIIVIASIVVEFIIIKKIKTKYTLNKKEFITTMSIFSVLSLYDILIYIVMSHSIPPIKSFIFPVLFIVTTYIGLQTYLRENIKQ